MQVGVRNERRLSSKSRVLLLLMAHGVDCSEEEKNVEGDM